jgi:acetyl esterase/lipase
VVVPSYRLAPANPHPAQIEDVAAAFAWTVKNIERYGGDPKRIFLGGHSAGGHLVALLALDGRYLAEHALQPVKTIRGVVAMSGVYEITNLEFAFGQDPEGWKKASPMTYAAKSAPPFVVTYCQWDYATLPAQARRFDAALRRAGARSELVYVPGQNHISEIINSVQDGDLTAQSVLRLIGLGPSPTLPGGSK